MAIYRRPSRHRFVLLLATLVSITVITLDQRGQGSGVIDAVRSGARDVLSPLRSATEAVVSGIGDAVGGITRYSNLENENAKLRQRLAEERGLASRAADAERERQDLLRINKLPFVGDIPAVAASVVSTSPSNFALTVEIDQGKSAGVAKGMPVVAGEGLVGRVVEVSSRSAVVLLLTDPSSNLGVRFPTSDVGVAKGRGSGEALSIDYIDPGVRVRPGQVVVTSGLEHSVYPPGVPVGRVKSARARRGALQQDISLDPVVDFRRLAFVKVLKWQAR